MLTIEHAELAFLQDGHEIIELLAVDGEEVVDDEGAAPPVPPHPQVGALRAWIQQVDHLGR